MNATQTELEQLATDIRWSAEHNSLTVWWLSDICDAEEEDALRELFDFLEADNCVGAGDLLGEFFSASDSITVLSTLGLGQEVAA